MEDDEESKELKRYAVFCGEHYYPGGGWEDFDSSHDTEEEARAACETDFVRGCDWHQIVDLRTGARLEN